MNELIAEQMRERGWTDPQRLLSDEEAAYLTKVARRTKRYPFSRPPFDPTPEGKPDFAVAPWFKSLHAVSPEIFDLALRPGLIDAVRCVLGDDILLWGAAILRRVPDQIHRWHVDVEHKDWRGVSVFIGLSGVRPGQSSLKFMSGSHRFEAWPDWETAESDAVTLAQARRSDPAATIAYPHMSDGEFVMFEGGVWHASHNTSDVIRHAAILQYTTPDQRVRAPLTFQRPVVWHDGVLPCILASGSDTHGLNRLISRPTDDDQGPKRSRPLPPGGETALAPAGGAPIPSEPSISLPAAPDERPEDPDPDPARATALESESEAFSRAGQWPRELETLDRLLRQFPKHPRSHIWLSRRGAALTNLGRLKEARDIFVDLDRQFPDLPLGPTGLARIAGEENNWALCAELWRECIQRFPSRAMAAWHSQWARALEAMDRIDEAASVYTLMTHQWPDDPSGWVGLARNAGQKNDWSLCAELWQDCIRRFSGRAIVAWYSQWTRALESAGRIDEARAAYTVMTKTWPQNPSGWLGLARGAGAQGRWKESAAHWRDCINRFKAQATSDWREKLEEALSNAREAAADRAASVETRARARANAGDWLKAARDAEARGNMRAIARAWTDACTLGAPTAGHLKKLTQVLIHRGDFARAAETIETLKGRNPDMAEWLPLLVNLCLARGAWCEARDAIRLHAPGGAAAKVFSTTVVTQILRNAGTSVDDAMAYMADWPDLEEARSEILRRFGIGGLTPDDSLEGFAPETIIKAEDWRIRARGLLKRYLKRRLCQPFENFVEHTIAYCDERQARKLHGMAVRRFPDSRIRIRLDNFIARHTDQPPASSDTAYPWRVTLPTRSNSILPALTFEPRRLALATVIQDEREMLGRFIAHYAALGVGTFYIVDNNSKDEPEAIVAGFPDLEIHMVSAPWLFRENASGMAWINELLEAGVADWVLFADCDELLVYPGCGAVKLPELLDHFDSRGETAMTAFMLDLFDADYHRTGRPADDFDAHDCIYAEYFQIQSIRPPYRNVQGGIRTGNAIFLNKTPLVKASAGVRYLDNHHVTPCRPAATSGVLRHYKLFRDRQLFGLDPADIATARRISDRGAFCIKRHVAMTRTQPGESPTDHVLTVKDDNLFVTLGYMKADDALRNRLGGGLATDHSEPAQALFAEVFRKQGVGYSHLWAQPALGPLLDAVVELSESGRQADVRAVLRAQLRRYGHPAVKRAMLFLALHQLNRSSGARVARGALMRAIERMETDANEDQARSLTAIFTRLVAVDPESVMALSEALLKKYPDFGPLRLLRRDLARPAQSRAQQEKPTAAPWRVSIANESHEYLVALRLSREWPTYYEHLERVIGRPDFRVSRLIVMHVNMCADPDMATLFLRRILEKHPPADVDKNTAVPVLGALRSLGMDDEILAHFPAKRDLLPQRSRIFLDRLVARPQPGVERRPTIWCLGFSKTGTTSLQRYLQANGLASAHFLSDFSLNLLDMPDALLHDVVCDSSAVYLARKFGVDSGSDVIVTTREFESWERSFHHHFSREMDTPHQTFDSLKAVFYSGPPFSWRNQWYDIHHELYFRFGTLREAYDAHHDWLAPLAKTHRFLEVNLQDADKGERIAGFLGLKGPTAFPRLNVSEG